MKEKQSKQTMEQQFKLLGTIRKAQPDTKLYAAIKLGIKEKQEQAVPWEFLRSVAAIFILMFAAQIYFTSTTSLSENDNKNTIVSVNSNTLYDEY